MKIELESAKQDLHFSLVSHMLELTWTVDTLVVHLLVGRFVLKRPLYKLLALNIDVEKTR